MTKLKPATKSLTKTDITFIKDIPRAERRNSQKTLERFNKIVSMLKEGMRNVDMATALGVSKATVTAMRAELVRASEEGFKTLEDYLEAGRPLSKQRVKLA